LCKALAEFLFDSGDAMVRIDMSEFMEKHSVARLIGAPPGYVGFEEGGYLTEAVRRRPYSVILLDEVEKAHPDVFNVLLQVLDDGRLTDGQGRTVDFRNTVIVMTSNLGSQHIQEISDASGDSPESYTQMKAAVMASVQAHFRPEFINRLDDIVVFHPLGHAQIRAIARIQTAYLAKRLLDRQIRLEISDAALALLGNAGFDPVYGARPLKRAIQQQLGIASGTGSCPANSAGAMRWWSRPRAAAWSSARPDRPAPGRGFGYGVPLTGRWSADAQVRKWRMSCRVCAFGSAAGWSK